jgi:4-hydroxy-tetrahydrodipicolinate synthase
MARAASLLSLGFFLLSLSTVGGEESRPPCCNWAGIYPTVLAPWTCDGGVDEASLACQINRELRGGVHGLLVLGTLGEGEYASMDERTQIIHVAVQTAQRCVPVVVGIHTCDVQLALTQAQQAKQLGAQAVLVKYFGNPRASCEQVLGYFAELNEKCELPIFYYHYPSESGLKLSPCCVAQILGMEKVVGIKESTLDLREVEQHIVLTRGLGRVFLSGTALNLTQFMDLGGHGAMSPEAVLMPGTTVRAYQAYVTGRRADAVCLQSELFATTPIMRGGMTSEDSSRVILTVAQNHHLAMPMGHDHPQARMKYALNKLCVPTLPLVKCPLPTLSWHDRHKVDRTLKDLHDTTCNPAPTLTPKVARASRLLPD